LRRVAYAAAEELLVKAVQLRRATSTTPADQEAELLAITRLLEVARARRYFQGATDLDVLDRAKELAERVGRQDILQNLVWFEWSALATACRRPESDPLAHAFADLTRDDPRVEMRAAGLEVLGVLHWQAGHITESAEHLDAGMRLLSSAGPPRDAFDAEMRFVSRCFWIWTHTMTGALSAEEAYAEFDRLMVEVPDRFAISSICGFAATTAIALGDWPTTERYVRMGVEADPGSQFAFWGGQVLMQRSIVTAWRGDVDAALKSFAEGRARYTGIGGRSGVPTFEASLALNVARQGRVTEAVALIESARAEFETFDERWNEPIVLIGEAVVVSAAGDVAGAEERLARAATVAREQGSHVLARRAEELVLVTEAGPKARIS
ncbi:MAG: hypothetical protein M3179_14120, partial [Actinomycetota bacterium]|nr:hypothetical protein [Actinomycetota bacterium]